jgi:glycosyltransferase involved in cell wall biosynthesis
MGPVPPAGLGSAPRRGDTDARRPLVLISGKDVLLGVGGQESYVRAHALAAARAGFAPHVFFLGARSAVRATEFGTVHTVGAAFGCRPPVAFHRRRLARAVATLLAEHRGPHVIHSFAIWSGAGVTASRLLARRGITAVPVASAFSTRKYEVAAMQGTLVGPHHRLAHRLRYRAWLAWVRLVDDAIEGRSYARSRVVLVNYESVRRLLTEAYGPGLEIRKVPYAAESAFEGGGAGGATGLRGAAGLGGAAGAGGARGAGGGHAISGGPTRAPLVVAISRHDPRKGLDLLLFALAELAAAGIAFRACLVGPGRLLATHRRLAADLGLADHVEIPGRVADVWPYLSAADVFVLPSVAEASGSVSVLEALQSGTPVIASNCDGIPEDLVDGVDALLFPSGDSRALARALAAVLTDPSRRAELAAGARRAYEQKFSASGFVAELARTYAELGVVP